MAEGEWRRESGGGRVAEGEWRRASGGGRVAEGEWRRESGELYINVEHKKTLKYRHTFRYCLFVSRL